MSALWMPKCSSGALSIWCCARKALVWWTSWQRCLNSQNVRYAAAIKNRRGFPEEPCYKYSSFSCCPLTTSHGMPFRFCDVINVKENVVCERLQSALLKRAEDTEGDAAEASATKLRLQQQNSMALTVVSEPQTANGSAHPPILKPSVAPVQTVSPLVPSLSSSRTWNRTTYFNCYWS